MSDRAAAGEITPPSPRKPDGTVDWQVVFEDPEFGLIAAIEKAGSTNTIRFVAAATAKHLYKRKNDAVPRQQFIDEMAVLIAAREADGGLAAVRASVIARFRAEQQQREEKARQYVDQKQRGQSLERRGDSFAARISNFLVSAANRRVVLAGLGAVTISGGALAMVWWLLSDPAKTPPALAPVAVEKNEGAKSPEAAEKPETPSPEPEPIKKPNAPPVERFVVMKPMTLTVTNTKGHSGNLALVPVIRLNDIKNYSGLCKLAPKISDSILNAMLSRLKDNKYPTAEDLLAIAETSMAAMNRFLPNRPVSEVRIVRAKSLSGKTIAAAYAGCRLVETL
ncbi:MAG: hypothetical protein O2944_09390 [Proteobacteria bacterium]|nr:hypothetical protein [Pseudomonadota bacterium]